MYYVLQDIQHGILEVNHLLEVNQLFEWGFLGFLKIYFKNCDFKNQLFLVSLFPHSKKLIHF